MKRWQIALVPLCAICVGAFSCSPKTQEKLATVSVQTDELGTRIPKNFAGFSLEVSTAGQGIGAFAPDGKATKNAPMQAVYALGTPEVPNKVFFQFMHNLGPGILRLGGNSQDNTCWDKSKAPHPDWCKGELSAGDFKLYADAAEESGWKLIVGINLKQNSGKWALGEVRGGVAKEIPADDVIGLELGNEPDLFARADSRPKDYSPADHAKEFMAYRDGFQKDAIAKKYAVIGPATCCGWRKPTDLGVFLDGVGADSLKLVTVHSYMLTTCGDKSVTATQLLSPELMTKFNDEAKGLIEEAHKRKLPIALAETNSASCGGMPGVSNAFAATLWGLDTLFSAAEDGYSGVNYHFSYRPGGSSYNPVDTYAGGDVDGYKNVVQPLYYGMYMFAQSASGESLLTAKTETGANVRAYATTDCKGCAVHVVVLNKDLSAAGRVSVHLSAQGGGATLLLLSAPKMESHGTEVTYGGVQFDESGRLPSPHTEEVKADDKGNYEFELPGAAIALLTIPAK